MKRKLGYYWVKGKEYCSADLSWFIAGYYGLGEWGVPGSEESWNDKSFSKIDERRIERPVDPERIWYDHGGE